jgi:hypothetical protein
VLFVIDFAQFAGLPPIPRTAVVGGLAAMPILFSGIVFIRSFAASTIKGEALGANLMGSLAGGLLQTLTFLTGVRALLLLVALLYLIAAILQVAHARQRDTVEAAFAAPGS